MDKLSINEKIIAAAGVVLFIASFLPWYSVKVNLFGVSKSFTASGWEDPNPIWSVLAVLLGVAMVAQILVSKFSEVEIPKIANLSWPEVHRIAGIAIAVLVLIKLLAESSHLGFGFFIAIICASALAYGGFMYAKDEPAPSA